MQSESIQIEYIPSPPVNKVVPRCARNFCPTFGRDILNYAKKDTVSCILTIVVGVWFIVDIILFSIAYSSGNLNIWFALGLTSTVIPVSALGLFLLITTCLYCGKIYRDSSEEITLENHPDLRPSLEQYEREYEKEFMTTAFEYDEDII